MKHKSWFDKECSGVLDQRNRQNAVGTGYKPKQCG
jgi:hypothetical protein